MPSLTPDMPMSAAAAGSVLQAQQLAELGAVLCLYRADAAGELHGWSQAVSVSGQTHLDSDGVHESLRFEDASGQCCWRLFLLPDSDFLAWERLLECVPRLAAGGARQSVGERLWQQLAGRLRSAGWRARVLRLHALSGNPGQPRLAASPAAISSLGAQTARRIAQSEGSDIQVRVDDCCCARAAASFRASNQQGAAGVDDAAALIKLQSRKQP
ncbi:hypothetical protein [Pseudoxanthomonas dokdonensis]|uniref:Hemin transport protein n=1 Tax=Pseudoxanthomonas dokdonensis TaxID=344882 RepID=A0A0R0CYC8_9GAMM|nr:hypothetical protein [Pseudoxanthomonas dokdonensis]KRG70120.1 hypothetical protein ABB29_07820 [Pseudoxanthomonas dokdonensis]